MRKKPGPPPLPFLDNLKPRAVNLDDDTVKMALVLGGGNMSQGVRGAVRLAYRQRQSEPEKPADMKASEAQRAGKE